MSARAMGRRSRIDFASVIAVTDAPATPGRAAAVVTPEGYLEVDAYTARDGLLRYSDGTDSWIEYRPRAELERALASFANVPVTDDHPRTMVSADSWVTVAKGHAIGTPVLETVDGVTYMRQRLSIRDAATIAKVHGGKAQVSIGFTTSVVPTTNGVAADGTRCDAVQTAMAGNHKAIVDRGRAGPAVRLLMDDAAWYDRQAENDTASNEDPHVSQIAKPKTQGTRADEVGQPTDSVVIKAPDGSDYDAPTWVAAELVELARLRAAPAATPEPAAPVAPAPAPAAVPDAAVPPVAPAPGPAAPAPAAPNPEDENMSKDSIAAQVRKRGRLERAAGKCGLDDKRIDAADDKTLAREVIAKRMPWAKDQAAKADGLALDALFEAAAALPDAPENPFERARDVVDAAERDENDPEIRYLAKMGG
jgi:hypothetical protein